MKTLIRKCTMCNKYTLKNTCEICSTSTTIPHPARYSPDDKYIQFRSSDAYD